MKLNIIEYCEKIYRIFIPKKPLLERVSFFIGNVMGRRRYQEDTYNFIIDQNRKCLFAGIYDGHGGSEVSELLKEKIYNEFITKIDKGMDPESAFVETYKKISKEGSTKFNCGSTATNIFIQNGVLYYANVGDSPLYKIEDQIVQILHTNHDVSNQEELHRIQEAGGYNDGRYFINQKGIGLMVSRAIGDKDFQDSGIISTPTTGQINLTQTDQILLITSDGINLNTDQILEMLSSPVLQRPRVSLAKVEELIEASSSGDNKTVILIKI